MDIGTTFTLQRKNKRVALMVIPKIELPEIPNEDVRELAENLQHAMVTESDSITGFMVGDVVVPFRNISWVEATRSFHHGTRLSPMSLALVRAAHPPRPRATVHDFQAYRKEVRQDLTPVA